MRRRFVSAMVVAVGVPLAGAGVLAAVSAGDGNQASPLRLPILGPTKVVPDRQASVTLPSGWSRLESRPEGAVVRFGCYTGAMFAFLPWADEGTRVVLDPAIRRAEAYRDGIGLAFTYDPHRGCGPGDDRQAATEIVALLKSFQSRS
jgi:hypothetical protein